MNSPAATRARERWIAAWPGGVVIGILNGIVREATYGKRLKSQTAHQLSTGTAIAAFAVYFSLLEHRWPIGDRGEALAIGGTWLGLTIAFEFGFGRAVAKQTWRELLVDYNLAAGRTWPLVLAWIAAGPAVVDELNH